MVHFKAGKLQKARLACAVGMLSGIYDVPLTALELNWQRVMVLRMSMHLQAQGEFVSLFIQP